MALSLLSLARQNMALEPFVALDLACAGDAKPFRGGPIGFYLRHCLLL
jgi:hypothetical protein